MQECTAQDARRRLRQSINIRAAGSATTTATGGRQRILIHDHRSPSRTATRDLLCLRLVASPLYLPCRNSHQSLFHPDRKHRHGRLFLTSADDSAPDTPSRCIASHVTSNQKRQGARQLRREPPPRSVARNHPPRLYAEAHALRHHTRRIQDLLLHRDPHRCREGPGIARRKGSAAAEDMVRRD
ncbi:hypothetical protein IG631_17485 [Alternaria alternata]|nr:hypothetical protein IG631_17485 [Alternaria alternata]